MQLSKEQQQVVADNMGLVGKVIRDKVHNVEQGIKFCMTFLRKTVGQLLADASILFHGLLLSDTSLS